MNISERHIIEAINRLQKALEFSKSSPEAAELMLKDAVKILTEKYLRQQTAHASPVRILEEL